MIEVNNIPVKVYDKKIPVEVYSRVVGYFRPIMHWNKGKKEEFSDRKSADPRKINYETTKKIVDKVNN